MTEIVFDIYIPSINNEVTHFYSDVVIQMINSIGVQTNAINKIGRNRDSQKGIFVIDIFDVVKAHLCGYKMIVFWMQGLPVEESYMRNHSKLRVFVLRQIQHYAFKKVDFFFCVSKNMKHYIERDLKRDIRLQSYVMPCFNEEKPLTGYNNLVVDKGNNNFAYIGGLQKWQNYEMILKVFSLIKKRNKDSKLFVYTKEVEDAKRIADSLDVHVEKIERLSQDELREKLKIIKFGFVLRDNNIVNTVSTPTKLSNYLANRIIPIYTDSLNDFLTAMVGKKYQIILKSDDTEDEMAFKILNSGFMGDIDFEDLDKEYNDIFSRYYSKEYHIKEGGSRIEKFLHFGHR